MEIFQILDQEVGRITCFGYQRGIKVKPGEPENSVKPKTD